MVPPKFCELDIFFPVFSNYKVKIVFARPDDLRSVARYIADRDYQREPELDAGSDAFTTSSAEGGYANIYLPPNAEAGTVAHEAYHSVKGLMKFIGSLGDDSEVIAYHLGYLVDKAVEFNLKVAKRFKTKKEEK